MFTFGRAISALDYEVVAAQAPGVTRATAYWTFDAAAQRTLVTIYVDDDAGGVTAASAGARRAPTTPTARSPSPRPRRSRVTVTAILVVAANRVVDGVVAAATAAFTDPVTGSFSPAQMGIGQWLYRSAIDAALIVPGVVAVHQLDGELDGGGGTSSSTRWPTRARARSSTWPRSTSPSRGSSANG